MSIVAIVARPLLAGIFVASGVEVLRHPEEPAGRAAPVVDKLSATVPVVPADPLTAVRVNAAIHVAAGLTLAAGKFPRLSALLLAGTLVPTTVGGHRFWEAADADQRNYHRNHALKNGAILGGLLYAATDRRGRPGLGWRAARAAKEARRTAQALAKAGGVEAQTAGSLAAGVAKPVTGATKMALTAGRGAAAGAAKTAAATGRATGKAGSRAARSAGHSTWTAGRAGAKTVARAGAKTGRVAAVGAAIRHLIPG
jgi:putative oxidoreductase